MGLSKIITAIAIIVMLVVGFAVGLIASPLLMPQTKSSTDSIWDNISQSGVIKVGTDPSWPPYESLDNSSKIVGFEVDLADAVAAKLGLTIQWQGVGFDTIIQSVQSKQLDMGVSGFSINAERLNQVQFTIPHSITRAQVIMLESKKTQLGITSFTSLSDLKSKGLTVGTQSGTTEEEELTNAGVAKRSFNDYGAAITDMASANPSVDCVYAETPITTSWIAQYNSSGTSIVVVYDHPYYPCAFLINKSATTFADKFNGALAEVIASGQMDALKTKWNA